MHPALGGCYKKPGCRVLWGHDFVGDHYNSTNTPIPGNDPRDQCNGHGTHVSGIIGAKDKQFVGVAPDGELTSGLVGMKLAEVYEQNELNDRL